MNRLSGHVTAVEAHGSIMLVDTVVGERRLTSMLVGVPVDAATWEAGTPVDLVFKEAEVSLARYLGGMISMRNRMPCTVIEVERGRLLTRVRLDFDGNAIESIITTRSCVALGIAPGVEVEALVKANEMAIMPRE